MIIRTHLPLNSAQMTRATGNQERGVTATDFFHRFPDLAPFLLAELQEATRSQTDLHPSLVSPLGQGRPQRKLSCTHLATIITAKNTV